MMILIGIILSIFLSLLLIGKKSKHLSDKILLAWLIAIAISLILFQLQTEEARHSFPFFLGWGFSFPLLHWPFLYLYVLSLTSREPQNVKQLLHFSPFFLSILLFSKYLFLPDDVKIDIYNKQGKGYEIEMTINLIAIIISAVGYTIISSYRLWMYKRNIKNEFSFTEKITLNWLLYLIIGMTCILLIVLFAGNDSMIHSSITVVIFYIGYFGIKQVDIFKDNLKVEQSSALKEVGMTNPPIVSQDLNFIESTQKIEILETAPTAKKAKYEKTKLSDGEINAIHLKIKELMHNEKLYKNPELTLSEVAKRIPIHPNALSQVINTVERKSFYDYINFQRVEEFQRIALLPKSNQYTLLSLAFKSGFNSKTSFNRNFKKVTNQSPSEFLKQKNIQLQE